MASLWSLLHGQHRAKIGFNVDVFTRDHIYAFIRAWDADPPKLVNITDYTQTWIDDPGAQFDLHHMDATPGFKHMWFEWLVKGGQRNAMMVERRKIDEVAQAGLTQQFGEVTGGRFFLNLVLLNEEDGRAAFRAMVGMHIDHLGCLTGNVASAYENEPEIQRLIMLRVLLVCDALTSMNTCGTKMVPPFDSPHAQIVKPDRAPCSVWHTIQIPKFQNPPLLGAVVTPEVLERREHWVRAHRRDYRHGNGMFGRVKALVWVPEFQRGNQELGTVQQSYEVRQNP